ncbi:hypothetical protein [Marinospirillum perlucidum]|uniref:hypothetical protein n=1 Tax=Marinospirillum perlucidum TaxID=1982602 RepID=UPI000DF1DF15|nr:hypothetical protein [Marinospirillum perlucidum]
MSSFQCFVRASWLLTLGVIILVSLLMSGCSLFSGSESEDENQLSENSYPVLVIFSEELATTLERYEDDFLSLLSYQNLHYRSELAFTLESDILDAFQDNPCFFGVRNNREGIEVLGDTFVDCRLNNGGYRTLAYLYLNDQGLINITLIDRNKNPRTGYFKLPSKSALVDVLAGELVLWMNEQARFADLKTW